MRARSGVSPIIATMILILIATAAGVLLWFWVSGYVSRNPAMQSALEERIKIEAVRVDVGSEGTTITLYVRNIGSITVNISSGYVLDMNGNLIMGGPLNEVMIKPGEVGRVIISSNQTLIRENMYLAKVVTRRGTESLYSFVVPP
jgi:archaellum component FlaF (FlaF/FlaG flagellin family)